MTDQGLASVGVETLPKARSEKQDPNNELLGPPSIVVPSTPTKYSIGVLSGEYPCVHNFVQGTLSAGAEALSFDGRFFFYKHTFLMMWSDIQSIQKTEVGVLQIKDQHGSLYEFTGIPHTERVWATLVSLHNESRLDHPYQTPLQTAVRASYRRMSTEPVMLHNEDQLPKEEAAYMAAATIAQMDDVRVLSERRMAPITGADISTDLETAWTELHDATNKDKSYSDVAIQDGDLSCDLSTFFTKFYSDDAPYSIQQFMESNGDKDVSVSHWNDEGSHFKRTMEYSHPINAPLAPPEARARKEQRYRRFGDFGLSIETDTFVDDVPMADCFYVTDRILVKPTANGVQLKVEFDIRFVKTTMFRSIIANTTRREFVKGFQKLFVVMETSLLLSLPVIQERPSLRQSLVKGISQRLSLAPVHDKISTHSRFNGDDATIQEGGGGSRLITVLLLAVLIVQGYVVHEVGSMKQIMAAIPQGNVVCPSSTVERVIITLENEVQEL